MAHSQFNHGVDDSDCPYRDNVDMSIRSDSSGEFEKLSLPCSDDEAAMSADIKQLSPTAQMVKTPLTMPTASVPPFTCTEDCQRALGSVTVEKSSPSTSSELVTFAHRVEQLMAAEIQSEVEKQMRLERAQIKRQMAEYECTISALKSECFQLTSQAEQHCCRHCDQQREDPSLKDTCRRLQQENDCLSQRCAKLDQQVNMVAQQAAEANRQMKENEDELHALRAEFSASRVSAIQQRRQTFEVVSNKPVVQMERAELVQTPRASNTSLQNVWTCPRCTYDNPVSVKKCEMCELPWQSRTLEC